VRLLPVLILLFVCLACSQSTRRAETTAEPTPATKRLSATVEMTGSGLKVTNEESSDLYDVTLKLNMTQWGGDDGRAHVGTINKGKSVTIPYRDFTVGTKRFNPNETVILTVYVKNGEDRSKLFLCPGRMCQPASN
jgi:hypothetical protein